MADRPSPRMREPLPFTSLYRHGFVRIAACAPRVAPADPTANAARIAEDLAWAHEQGAVVALFPELSLSGYAIDDLVLQGSLLAAVRAELQTLADTCRDFRPLGVVGAPLEIGGAVYNCAVAFQGGRILAVAPKSYLPTYREFYERRWFASGLNAPIRTLKWGTTEIPFGADLVLAAEEAPDFKIHMEICEDLWAPQPPSTRAALAGASVLLNLSASNITIGKSRERAALVEAQARKCVAAYIYAASGAGESSTDLAFDGQLLAYEMEELLAEGPRFSRTGARVTADVDLGRLAAERRQLSTFRDAIAADRDAVGSVRTVPFAFIPPSGPLPLRKAIARYPFAPNHPQTLHEDCFEAYSIQVAALATRLEATGVRKAVIGVSGGLDSTHALIVTARAFDLLDRPRTDIIGVTLPGPATSQATKANAHVLMAALGVDAREVSIGPLTQQMLSDLGHPAAKGEAVYDVTFENVQAGLRTDYLFRLANHEGGLVIGTGDLSELALGWCTYGVGDHMSHYSVNSGAPKTLIQQLIGWVARENVFDPAVSERLEAILATAISPELVPPDASGAIQDTEASIGPYCLHDFFLHHMIRRGAPPSKTLFLAQSAWGQADRGDWPENAPLRDRRDYPYAEIRKWLEVFVQRFFQTSQFKRSALPNGPKIASAGALSPRGDWRAPSDGSAKVWLDELTANAPTEDPETM